MDIEYINKVINKNLNEYQNLGGNYDVIALETPFNEIKGITGVNYDDYRITEIGLSQATINSSLIIEIRSDISII